MARPTKKSKERKRETKKKTKSNREKLQARIPSDLEKVTDPKTGEVYYREKLSTFKPVRKA